MFDRSRQGVLRAMLAVAMAVMCGMAVEAATQDEGKAVTASAPMPTAIQTAKRVFVGCPGVDDTSLGAFRRGGDMNQPYNAFYAAMKNWGRHELVGSPAPALRLEILDAKTHFVLWTIVEPVGGAYRKATWDKNFNSGMTNLVSDLKNVTGGTQTASK